MVYLQDGNILDTVHKHLHSLGLLAREKNIKFNIDPSLKNAICRNFDFIVISEIILVIIRIILDSKFDFKIFVGHDELRGSKCKVTCLVKGNSHGHPFFSNLNEGLNVYVETQIIDSGIQIDIHHSEDIRSRIEPARLGNESKESTKVIKPFHDVLRKNLKNYIPEIKDLYEKAINRSVEDGKFLEQVLLVINDNIANPKLNTYFLSRKLMVSRSKLYRKLKILTGKSPATYIRYIRMMQARSLLELSSASIGDLAYAVGYSDQSHFTRAFKNQFGLNPSCFRKNREEH